MVLKMKHKNIVLFLFPFIIFVLLNVIYYKYFEMTVINYFDCGDFTYGINYELANLFLLLLFTAIYIALYIIFTRRIDNKIILNISYITNSSIATIWIIYLLLF
jgi:hypothetical protein